MRGELTRVGERSDSEMMDWVGFFVVRDVFAAKFICVAL